MKLFTQLNCGGNCEEAFRFYEEHLGSRITAMMPEGQVPGASAGTGRAIIHAQLDIGETVLMANDVPSSLFERIRSVYLYLAVDSPDEAERLHELLSEGGEIYIPMRETFFATRFSQVRDRFGVSWSIIHERAGT